MYNDSSRRRNVKQIDNLNNDVNSNKEEVDMPRNDEILDHDLPLIPAMSQIKSILIGTPLCLKEKG